MALKMFIYTFQSHLFNSTISRFYISELKHQSFESEEDDNYVVTALEIMPEHVHLLASIEPKYSVTEIVGRIKGYSSLILRREFFGLKRIRSLWTSSKFVASTGGVTLEALKEYVEGQKYKEYRVDSQMLIHLPF